MYESIKALEMKISIIFNPVFKKTKFYFFFLIIDLYSLIPAVITQICNPNSELVIPARIPTKEKKSKT